MNRKFTFLSYQKKSKSSHIRNLIHTCNSAYFNINTHFLVNPKLEYKTVHQTGCPTIIYVIIV